MDENAREGKGARFRRVARSYLGDEAARRIPGEAGKVVYEKLEEMGCPHSCFWRYMLSTSTLLACTYANVLRSERVWEGFRRSRAEALDKAKVRTGLEMDAFQAELDFRGPGVFKLDTINPLTKYLLGRFLQRDVREFEEGAKQLLREEPCYFDTYERLRRFFPVSLEEVIAND